ncbi:MAG: DUF177 domain-containing protein [Lachnospiraceae bacterium]|nr:DUF177 domain-containing protein [Lachnospiraceae bacterium]
MRIHLSESQIREGECRRYEAAFGFDRLSCRAGDYPVRKAEPVVVKVANLGNQKYRLEVHIVCTLGIPCDRCLDVVDWPFHMDAEQEIDLKQSEQDRLRDLDEKTYIQGYHFDVDEFVRGELFLNMPMKVLCREDCAGIGNGCGTDPVIGACEYKEKPPDPRMAVIQEIFDKANTGEGKEV